MKSLSNPISYQALHLGTGAKPGSYMVETIWQELAKAKYLEWEHASSKRSWDLQGLKYATVMNLQILSDSVLELV